MSPEEYRRVVRVMEAWCTPEGNRPHTHGPLVLERRAPNSHVARWVVALNAYGMLAVQVGYNASTPWPLLRTENELYAYLWGLLESGRGKGHRNHLGDFRDWLGHVGTLGQVEPVTVESQPLNPVLVRRALELFPPDVDTSPTLVEVALVPNPPPLAGCMLWVGDADRVVMVQGLRDAVAAPERRWDPAQASLGPPEGT